MPIPASRKLRTLAVAAMAALVLSACGGGGGAGGSGGSGGGPSGSGPSLGAGGVSVGINRTGTSVTFHFSKNGSRWADTVSNEQDPPTGWFSDTRQNSANTEFARAVTNIDAFDDKDYLTYGYWSKLPIATRDSGDFKPFYHGTMPYTGNVVALTGSAVYTGGATGVYALNPGEGSTAVDGRFTADVRIEVNFGLDTEAANVNLGISNIATLTSGGSAGPTLSDIPDSTLRAKANGPTFTADAPVGDGRWGGRFFGPPGGVPTGVAGWFEHLRTAVSGGPPGNYGWLTGSFGAAR